MNEKALIRLCLKGEKQAFEERVYLFYLYVSRFPLKTCSDGRLSEDLAQDTFLKMIHSVENYDFDEGKCGEIEETRKTKTETKCK